MSNDLVHVPKSKALAKRSLQDRYEAALGDLWGRLESEESQRGYRSDWRRYVAWCALEEIIPTEATVADVQRYVNEMRDRKLSKATRSRALSVMREVYRALVVAELCVTNPAREVKNPKVSQTPRTPWMDEDKARAFFEAPWDDDWYGKRDHLIVSCLFLLGWRRAEVARIEVEHIQNKAMWHRVKRGKEETVGLPVSLEKEIEDWKAFAGIVKGPLFPRSENNSAAVSPKIVYDVVKKRAKKIGAPKLAPHAIRRSYASILITRGEDLKAIQMALSHTSQNITERYVHSVKAATQAPGEKLSDLVYGAKKK